MENTKTVKLDLTIIAMKLLKKELVRVYITEKGIFFDVKNEDFNVEDVDEIIDNHIDLAFEESGNKTPDMSKGQVYEISETCHENIKKQLSEEIDRYIKVKLDTVEFAKSFVYSKQLLIMGTKEDGKREEDKLSLEKFGKEWGECSTDEAKAIKNMINAQKNIDKINKL